MFDILTKIWRFLYLTQQYHMHFFSKNCTRIIVRKYDLYDLIAIDQFG